MYIFRFRKLYSMNLGRTWLLLHRIVHHEPWTKTKSVHRCDPVTKKRRKIIRAKKRRTRRRQKDWCSYIVYKAIFTFQITCQDLTVYPQQKRDWLGNGGHLCCCVYQKCYAKFQDVASLLPTYTNRLSRVSSVKLKNFPRGHKKIQGFPAFFLGFSNGKTYFSRQGRKAQIWKTYPYTEMY